VTCTPCRSRFRWAYGRYFALPHTSVCVGFGYRSFSWWSCLPLGPGRKSPRYIYRYLLVCDHWPTASSCGSLASPRLRQNEVRRGLWAAYGFGWHFFFLEFCEVSVLSLVVHCWGGGFSYGLHVCGGFFGSLYSGLYALL